MNDSMSKLKTTVAGAGKLAFDLHERTACFGEQIISFAKSLLPQEPACREKARKLWQEAKELHLIFAAIFRKKTSD